MADISYTYKATEQRAASGASASKGFASQVIGVPFTIELAASASGTTFKMARIPANARLFGGRIYNDDLATSGSPTLNIGLASVNANVTSDDDALNTGLALSTAGVGVPIVKEIANIGKPAYLHVSGQTTDPQGSLDVYGTVKAAATTATGTITGEILYCID